MDKKKKDLLVFGYGLALIAATFAIGGIHKHGLRWPQMVQAICSVVFAWVTVTRYEALRPGYRGWMTVAHLIGTAVTTVVLGVVFFLLFAPIGLFFRLIGKDHLERRFDKTAESYWHHRAAGAVNKARYKQQF